MPERGQWSGWPQIPLRVTAAAALLEILRQAVDTRKTALVEVALDLIQRLIAHQALQVSKVLSGRGLETFIFRIFLGQRCRL